MVCKENSIVRLGLPKGRMEAGVMTLLRDANINVSFGNRAYRPKTSLPGFEVKLQKPQNIIEMLSAGSRDIGFAGKDWVAELQADLVELLDTGMDPIRLVAAAPASVLKQRPKEIIVASEFERLTKEWISKQDFDATFLRSYGATEVFPPEDADYIIDITQTGATLEANSLEIVLYANPKCLDIPAKRDRIEGLVLVLRSVLDARKRVFMTLNVSKEDFEQVIEILPCMKAPTVYPLSRDSGFAISVAIPKEVLATLIPEIKSRGGTDIVVTQITQLVS
jgi:ATP phosphoribosyltransferase